MMCRSISTEQLPIQSVRQPCDRMPVAGIDAGERPFDRCPGDTRLDMRVLSHVIRIVVVDEAATGEWPKSPQRQCNEPAADQDRSQSSALTRIKRYIRGRRRRF